MQDVAECEAKAGIRVLLEQIRRSGLTPLGKAAKVPYKNFEERK